MQRDPSAAPSCVSTSNRMRAREPVDGSALIYSLLPLQLSCVHFTARSTWGKKRKARKNWSFHSGYRTSLHSQRRWDQFTAGMGPVYSGAGTSSQRRYDQPTGEMGTAHSGDGNSSQRRGNQLTAVMKPAHSGDGTSSPRKYDQITAEMDPVHSGDATSQRRWH